METIIVQDTDEDILNILTQALELEGFSVYPLLDCGEDFMDLIDKARPHVIMLDFRLNGERCIDICRQIKKIYPHLPVIALSCNNNINDVYDKYGFDGYIKKPFDLDLLYSVLRKHIPPKLVENAYS